jgi:hypothetical protein
MYGRSGARAFYGTAAGGGRRPSGLPYRGWPIGFGWRYTTPDHRHRVGRVVGHEPGWLDPTRANSLGPLLSLSPPLVEREREREREREPGIRIFFFALYTSPRAAKRRGFRGVTISLTFFWFPPTNSLYMSLVCI